MDAEIIQFEPASEFLENRPFSDIRVGDSGSLVRSVSMRDIQLFAAVSGSHRAGVLSSAAVLVASELHGFAAAAAGDVHSDD